MANQSSIYLLVILIALAGFSVVGKPLLLTCDTFATSSTCSRSSSEGTGDCDTCCNMLLERMFDCPACRHFLLHSRPQGSSCFCTVCFKQQRHRRRHHAQQQPSEQDSFSRFDV